MEILVSTDEHKSTYIFKFLLGCFVQEIKNREQAKNC